MKKNPKLIPLEEAKEIYARPGGWHYHLSRQCPMLQGKDFECYKYKDITKEEVKKRKLRPCVCAFSGDVFMRDTTC